jgi:uncharacterized phage protein (TIGR02220 family)
MPNRIIKESICTSPDIDQLNPEEEIFFYRLMVNCDDYGRLDARLPILKAKLYPLKENMKSSDIKRYLKRLCDIKPSPLIFIYENNNIPYLQMVSWDKHQQIRAKRSKHPAFNDEGSVMISHDINGNQLIAYVPENPIQSESESESESKTINDVLEYLNNKLDTKYKSRATRKNIKTRINEGFTYDDFVTVIDKKYAEWHNTDMAKFLRPETLFSNKFEGYLNQIAPKTPIDKLKDLINKYEQEEADEQIGNS